MKKITLSLALMCLGLGRSSSLAQEVPGLVAERPTQGRFVETDRGFMVPYTATIPGSDVKFEMVPIPGGVFKMGSPPDEPGRREDEGPKVEVEVEPFWMGKHEVTWAEYRRYMAEFQKAGGAARQAEGDGADAVSLPSPPYDDLSMRGAVMGERCPAQLVTQFAARQYTKWLSLRTGKFYRLPSEAEWEYACRAGQEAPATLLDEFAWHAGNSGDEFGDPIPHEVGLKRPNPWGLHDMLGNVAEWVIDQHGPYPPRYRIQWPDKRFGAVTRGGSCEHEAAELRCAARWPSRESWQDGDAELPRSLWWMRREGAFVGFRLVRPSREPGGDEKKNWWEATGEWASDYKVFEERARVLRVRVANPRP